MPQSDFSRLTIDTVYAANLKFTNYIHSNNVNINFCAIGERDATAARKSTAFDAPPGRSSTVSDPMPNHLKKGDNSYFIILLWI
jgi:hypothetical protein